MLVLAKKVTGPPSRTCTECRGQSEREVEGEATNVGVVLEPPILVGVRQNKTRIVVFFEHNHAVWTQSCCQRYREAREIGITLVLVPSDGAR